MDKNEIWKKIKEHGKRIRKLERGFRIPCLIVEGKWNCGEPYCEYHYYSMKAYESFEIYKRKIKSDLQEYENKKVNRK